MLKHNIAGPPVSAVFVDVENMSVDREVGVVDFDIGRVMERVGAMSRPIVRKAYADWFKLRGFRDSFLRHGFDQVQTTYINRSKNSLDMQMCVDAMETVLTTPGIEMVFLVTADSDFSPLARAIRRQGRLVIGLGWHDKTNEIFRAHCDEFIAYESLPVPPRPERPAGERRETGATGRRPARSPGWTAPAARPAPVAAAARLPRPARETRPPAAPPAEGARLLAELDPAIARLVLEYGPGAAITVRQFTTALRAVDAGFDPAAFGCRNMTALVKAHPLLRRDPAGPGQNFTVLLPRRMPLAALSPAESGDLAAMAARLAGEPVGFLGRERHYAVLAALHADYVARETGFTRFEVIEAVAPKVPELQREQIEHVERLVWAAKVFQVEDKSDSRDALFWKVRLNPRYHDFETLHFEHDKQLLCAAMTAGIVLDARGWAILLDGDDIDAADFADMLLDLGFIDPAFPPDEAVPEPEPEEAEAETETEEREDDTGGAGAAGPAQPSDEDFARDPRDAASETDFMGGFAPAGGAEDDYVQFGFGDVAREAPAVAPPVRVTAGGGAGRDRRDGFPGLAASRPAPAEASALPEGPHDS